MAKKASERARPRTRRSAASEQIPPSRARMLQSRGNEDDEDAEDEPAPRRAKVPAGWKKSATAKPPASNAAVARRFAGAPAAAPDPVENDVDDVEGTDGATVEAAPDVDDEREAQKQIQEFVLELALKYPVAHRLDLLFKDTQFVRAFPDAKPIDRTTVDVGNGTYVDIVDKSAPVTTAAAIGVKAQLRERMAAAMAGTTTTAPEIATVVDAIVGDPAPVTPAPPVDGPMNLATPPASWQSPPAPRGVPVQLPVSQQWIPTTQFQPPTFTPPQIELADVTYQDVDQLWDWARHDGAGVREFIGLVPSSSKSLYDWLYGLLNLQQQRVARVHSIVANRRLVGFVVLLPIERPENKEHRATVHLYLEPGSRGALPTLLPSLMELAERVEPGVTLVVTTTRPEWSRMLQGVGFESSLILTRKPRAKA